MADHALLTIDNPSAALTDFSLIVDLSKMPAAWWTAVTTTDGTKGRVYKGDGTTRLAADWIDFDETNETGLLRILWSGTLATTGTQQLWIEPPLTGNDAVAANTTYGQDNAYASHWAGYWPLHDELDRTSNSRDMTKLGSITTGGATGQIGASTAFDGSDDALGYNASIICQSEDSTLFASIWQDADAVPQSGGNAIYSERSSGTPIFKLDANDTDRTVPSLFFVHRDDSSSLTFVPGSASRYLISDETWTHIAVRKDAKAMNIYADGASAASATLNGGDTITSEWTYIGGDRHDNVSRWFGRLQHVHVHTAVLSTDWIASEYSQTNNNENFYTWSYVTGGGNTGTGTGSQPIQSGTAEGTVTPAIAGTITGSQPIQSGTGTGTVTALTIVGTCTGSQPVQSGTGTGSILAFPITGTCTGSQSVQSGTGTGTVVDDGISGTVTGSQPAQSGTGTGLLVYTGTATGSQPLQSGTGTGNILAFPITGTGTGSQPAQTGSGTGGTGDFVFGSGTGSQNPQTGTGEGNVVDAVLFFGQVCVSENWYKIKSMQVVIKEEWKSVSKAQVRVDDLWKELA